MKVPGGIIWNTCSLLWRQEEEVEEEEEKGGQVDEWNRQRVCKNSYASATSSEV